MDEKISLKALEDYSDDYASKVTASFFSSKEKISGSEILKLCDVHQINLFVIRELLYSWKLESNKLRSPFFDYGAPAVAEAIAKFQNILSNNISISKENFQPLLKKAVSQTLYLVLDPYDFYSEMLDRGIAGVLKTEDLKTEIKYVKINRIPLENLLKNLEEKKMVSITGNEAFALLDRILEEVNFTPEEIEGYVRQFSEIVPVDLDKFYEKPEPAKTEKHQPVKTERPEPVKTEKPEKIKVETRVAEPLVAEPPKQAAPAPTVHEQLPKTVHSLADDFQKQKKIKDSLTINQKFMFTKILFNGDFELFSAAIERLDELDNLSQAKSYLSNNYAEWNPESEEYQEFMEMVDRRFS